MKKADPILQGLSTRQQYSAIKKFLIENAEGIERLATKLHKKYLGGKKFRSEKMKKYEVFHRKIISEVANNLLSKNIDRGTKALNKIGEQLGQEAVLDGLTIEETVDGVIFLKQAMWQKLAEEDGLLELSTLTYHELNLIVGNYCDVVASRIAFTYHKDRQRIEANLTYLAEASNILSSSLDYEVTLNTVASLAVPHIADWCVIDILDNGKLKDVAIAHKDPKKVKWAKELRKIQPIDMNVQTGAPNVVRTGKPELYADITDELLKSVSKTKKEYELAKEIGFTSAMIVPLFQKKNPIGTITFVTAETNRHYNHADLLMARELATRASVAIENARLYKGSQEAISMRDEFISIASHELKTPITSVKMFTQILKKHSQQIGDKRATDYLSKMDNQLNKLTELIYDLLNVSKIQAGRMRFREELFDIDNLVKDIVEILQQTESTHKIKIQGKTNKKVIGDSERIGQVMNNLISNAVKYSPEADKVVIKLSSDKDNIVIGVQDFGIGMKKAHLRRIFERFYRVYDNSDKTFPGLGIGLYISSEIIRRHDGKLWVESNLGKGSTFYFSLPIRRKKLSKKDK